ncbi:DinB family protein [Leifsonia sp. NPDC058230]|uniref:DinB family protein n=1 Tax=Leifsonia sp. NPDC058230 TaxID=3346391 RepID=UPI0036DE5E54
MTEDLRAQAVKESLHDYLRSNRTELLAKLDGLGERDLRRPLTRTGTNLLGLVKHVASVQLGYFGETFGRPTAVEMPWLADDADVNADMWATPDETSQQIFEFWQYSAEHSDETIRMLDLDSPGSVPWWPQERRAVTLGLVLTRMLAEIARHAGHADIVRELIDGSAGNNDGNLPDQSDDQWSAYRERLAAAAEEAERRYGGRGA